MQAHLLNTSGTKTTLSDDGALGELKERIHGEIILPSHKTKYEEARKIWNAMIDRYPGMIVVCTGNADVIHCVKFAKEHSLKLTCRGGGHNIAGKSLENDAMCIDLSKWRTVNVDATRKIANVSPGATLGGIDHETQEYGLALPMGINSTTGISGLTLGGGYGWLSRKYGLTLDSLLSANVVTASGETVHCDEDSNSDLFWAIRGGGGNFGIVTNFEFQLHPVGPMVNAGPFVFPLEEAASVLKGLMVHLKAEDSHELSAWPVLRQAPPFPFVPEEFHFKPVLMVAVCYLGPHEAADAVVEPIKKLGTVLGNHFGKVPLAKWDQAFDSLLTEGYRNYWKTANFDSIPDEMVDKLIEQVKTVPNFGTELILAQTGGKTKTIDPTKTAFAHRNPTFFINCHTRWENEQEDAENVAFARELFEILKPFTDGTTYSNFVSEGDEATSSIYGENESKLAEIKAKYDPGNFFSVNYNIRPAA